MLFNQNGSFPQPQASCLTSLREWATTSMMHDIFFCPIHAFEQVIIPRIDARLICVPGPFVGLKWRTRLAP